MPDTEPSPRARELVRGAYDLHVHVEPDLAKRRIDDLGLAHRFAELGLAGFVLKSHYAPTAERKVSWEQTFDAIRATGPEHNVLSTDLGQVQNPPVEDGLALMADRLLEAGFSEDDVRTMAVTNTRLLAGV